MRASFAEAGTWEGVLLRTDTWCFSRSYLERGAWFLLEQMLDRTCNVWKRYKYNPTDSERHCVAMVYLATLCWFSLGFADAHLHWQHYSTGSSCLLCWHQREREMHQRTSCDSLPVSCHFCELRPTDRQTLVISVGSHCRCWFLYGVCEWNELRLFICVNWICWYPDTDDWNRSEDLSGSLPPLPY